MHELRFAFFIFVFFGGALPGAAPRLGRPGQGLQIQGSRGGLRLAVRGQGRARVRAVLLGPQAGKGVPAFEEGEGQEGDGERHEREREAGVEPHARVCGDE